MAKYFMSFSQSCKNVRKREKHLTKVKKQEILKWLISLTTFIAIIFSNVL